MTCTIRSFLCASIYDYVCVLLHMCEWPVVSCRMSGSVPGVCVLDRRPDSPSCTHPMCLPPWICASCTSSHERLNLRVTHLCCAVCGACLVCVCGWCVWQMLGAHGTPLWALQCGQGPPWWTQECCWWWWPCCAALRCALSSWCTITVRCTV